MLRRLSLAALFFTVFLGCSSESPQSPQNEKPSVKKLQIAVIPKGTTHEFWKSIHAGAVKAARELGVDIIWKGPQKEDDREQQIQVVQGFITSAVNGIVLAPLDAVALVKPVQERLLG